MGVDGQLSLDDVEQHVTLTGLEAAGFRSAADFYFAGRELDKRLAAGMTAQDAQLGAAEAVRPYRLVVTDEQWAYIWQHTRRSKRRRNQGGSDHG